MLREFGASGEKVKKSRQQARSLRSGQAGVTEVNAWFEWAAESGLILLAAAERKRKDLTRKRKGPGAWPSRAFLGAVVSLRRSRASAGRGFGAGLCLSGLGPLRVDLSGSRRRLAGRASRICRARFRGLPRRCGRSGFARLRAFRAASPPSRWVHSPTGE